MTGALYYVRCIILGAVLGTVLYHVWERVYGRKGISPGEARRRALADAARIEATPCIKGIGRVRQTRDWRVTKEAKAHLL